jgi:hypothetical protein
MISHDAHHPAHALTGVDTGGVPTLDLRRSSEPAPPAGRERPG